MTITFQLVLSFVIQYQILNCHIYMHLIDEIKLPRSGKLSMHRIIDQAIPFAQLGFL